MHEVADFQPSHTPFDFSRYTTPYEQKRTQLLERLIPYGPGAALDVGCGPGYFSRILTRNGWTTTAIDTDPQNIMRVSEAVVAARLGDALGVLSREEATCYDLVLALEIIEHMPRAYGQRVLREIARVLKPDGRLILSTPNRYSPEGLGGYYWRECIRRSGPWKAWDPTHVHIYTSCEILALLKETGFSISRVIGYHYEGHLPGIGAWRLPIESSEAFPWNRIGFNIIIVAQK